MVGLEKTDGGFRVRTPADEYEARHVVLALGTQGNPRRLGAPGEDLPHVATRLVDPDEFQDLDILVVGAGDSALEVAISLASHNRVGLVVRGAEILKAKESLEREILGLAARGQMKIHFSSSVARVERDAAELKTPAGLVRVPAQHIILKLGATPPRALLEGIGVQFAGSGASPSPCSPTATSRACRGST